MMMMALVRSGRGTGTMPSGGCLRDVLACVFGAERARRRIRGFGNRSGRRVVEFELSEVGTGTKIECGENK